MNKFLNSFVFPSVVFFAVIFTAYTAVLYCYKHIKSDPINQKYATLKEREQALDCLTENVTCATEILPSAFSPALSKYTFSVKQSKACSRSFKVAYF